MNQISELLTDFNNHIENFQNLLDTNYKISLEKITDFAYDNWENLVFDISTEKWKEIFKKKIKNKYWVYIVFSKENNEVLYIWMAWKYKNEYNNSKPQWLLKRILSAYRWKTSEWLNINWLDNYLESKWINSYYIKIIESNILYDNNSKVLTPSFLESVLLQLYILKYWKIPKINNNF